MVKMKKNNIKNEHWDHSITYTDNRFIYFTHRKRLNEIILILNDNLNNLEFSGFAYDFGGAGGYLLDYINKHISIKIKQQEIFDLEHPNNSKKNKNWYIPKISTIYRTFDLNSTLWNMNIKHKSIIFCTETLEHVGNPVSVFDNLNSIAMKSKSILFISYPVEHGLIGAIKCIGRILIGRNNKKGVFYNFKYLLFSFGILSDLRNQSSFYEDHDGFKSYKITNIIKQKMRHFENAIFLRGFSSIHILIDYR